jgi:hypothetical protein
LGSLKKAYQRKGELASAWDLPQAKPIRGRHKERIFIFILRKDFIKIFSFDFKISAIIRMKIYTKIF